MMDQNSQERSDFDRLLAAELGKLDGVNRGRCRRAVRHLDSTHVEIEGKRYVNFASNDYLGLTHHPRIIRAAREAIDVHGWGAGAAPLVTG